MRMYGKDYDSLTYWSDRYGLDKGEFLVLAMNHYIAWKNGDYDLPRAETQRLNQMVDCVLSLSTSQVNMEKTMINGFSSIIGVMRGDNYLTNDNETGDL